MMRNLRIFVPFWLVVILAVATLDAKFVDQLYRFNRIKSGGGEPPSIPMTKMAMANAEKPKRTPDKCEIEIITRGSCLVNNHRLKPKIILNFRTQVPFADQKMTTAKPDDDKLSPTMSGDTVEKRKVISEFITELIRAMKFEYGERLRPIVVDKIQQIQLRDYGRADVYDLLIYGMDTVDPVPDSVTLDDPAFRDDSPAWTFNATFHAANMTATFRVDVDIDRKIFVKNWKLRIRIEQCQFLAAFVLDFEQQRLWISSLRIKSFGDFRLMADEPLTWPFNEMVSKIVSQEKHFIRHVLELQSEQLINKTLANEFDLNGFLNKIFRQEQKLN